MNSSWPDWYDRFKDRRYGGIFWSTLLAIIASFALGGAIGLLNLQTYFLYLLSGIILLILACGFFAFRRAQAWRRKKLPRGPMSRDELRVARSKLRNEMRTSQRPAPRAPDTNLKY
jgi:hypothetical protein